MEDNSFKWTDELVNEFIGYNYLNKGKSIRYLLHEFKRSKQPPITQEKKDYRIESVYFDSDSKIIEYTFNLRDDGKYYCDRYPNEGFELYDDLLNNKISKKYLIHSVRRLSDSSIWSVGDDTNHGIIKSFYLLNNEMLVTCTYKIFCASGIKFSELKKLIPLFYTDDSPIPVAVYERDEWWSVFLDKTEKHEPFDLVKTEFPLIHNPNFTGKRFATEQAANSYILYNKKELSLNDLLSVWECDIDYPKDYFKSAPLFKNFENLVKQKLKQ